MSQNYPLHFKFKIGTISNDFEATDDLGHSLFYVREKIFTWRDTIKVYRDSSKSELLYELVSNKLIDFQQTFTITHYTGRVVGKVRRKTLRSLWRSTFHLMDAIDRHDHTITEKNPWTKMWDGLFGEIPILGALSGYIFNPSYILRNQQGVELYELRKEPSFFGRKFTVHKLAATPVDEERFLLCLMLIVLVERSNG
ncbi:hypothetical protein [Sphingobacterium suaedae]|uniref:Uncharacterized protein n=1 Tax=Sphingobacterium suaedae TaxID=1686402 RepID=A0ABW5KBR0_9SPHI